MAAKSAKKASRKRSKKGSRKASRKTARKARKTTGGSAAKRRRTRKKARKKAAPKLYTLTEVSKLAGVSMPTLQKYKKRYQNRIPSVGEGRRQRYPAEALDVFSQLKEENLARRGRPRKAAKGARKKARKRGVPKGGRRAAPKRAGEDLLTLTEVARRVGISYPTAQRYVKLHLDRIPHRGEGRRRRYPEEALEVFRQIRGESRRGPRKRSKAKPRVAVVGDAALAKRIGELERMQEQLAKQLDGIVDILKRPLEVTIKPR